MPVMNGVQFLAYVGKCYPETVRIMLTGQADLNAAMAAVNEGHVFRFLSKPCPATILARTLAAALDQYRLITAERELLRHTLMGSITMLAEILSAVAPAASVAPSASSATSCYWRKPSPAGRVATGSSGDSLPDWMHSRAATRRYPCAQHGPAGG